MLCCATSGIIQRPPRPLLSCNHAATRDTCRVLPRLRPAEPPIGTRWAALIAVGAGLLGVLAFPRFGVWPLAFASVASFSVLVHGRRARQAAWLGLVYGAAFFGPLLHWTGVY